MAHHPISDHAFLSDCHSAGLVTREGVVDWLCFPRFDSPSVFCSLLDEQGGYWRLAAVGAVGVSRCYLDRTLVVETSHRTHSGTVAITDALAAGSGERGHELGEGSPHVLMRQVVCRSGEVEVECEFVPRPEYGLARPLLQTQDGGVVTRGSPDALALASSIPLNVEDNCAKARFTLREGEQATFALQWARAWEQPARLWNPAEVEERLKDTIDAWQSWSEQHQRYQGPWRDLVDMSGRVLQGLTFQPTGAIVAAATTSLPEVVGGVCNWDYRYAWLRDASLTLDALWVAACPDEAHQFLQWLVGAAASDLRRGGEPQIMYGVGGEHRLSEIELEHLQGWRGSRPVRVGNDAWAQRQLDVYGELLDAVHRLREQLGELDQPSRAFLVDLADAAARRWHQPGQGIWEVRGEPQHFLYGKLMCWVALDRAIDLADWLDAHERLQGWTEVRDEIRAAILQRGWNEQIGAFTQAFDSPHLDASALMLAISGFLPATDGGMQATVKAIEERLVDERGLVCRFEGMPGDQREGDFLLCTFWLAHVHALARQPQRAREVFERAVNYRNDLDLFSEEVDPESGELLGNFPQALSHIGLVNAAWAISQAER